jgi:(p)ppGpp synthase/HD superfamily hydrolase
MKQSKTPDASAQRFGKALAFAAEKHAGQKRKGTRIPYISHPLALASLVLEQGGGEDEVIAALLHDVAEDHGGQAALDEIRQRFGMGVAAIVEGCTDTLESPKPKWRPRKEKYIEHLRGAHRSVRIVAAADKLHNARSILRDYRGEGEKVWKRFSASKEEVLWYYAAVTRALEARGSSPLVEELDRVVGEIMREARGSRGEGGDDPAPTTGGIGKG